MRRLIKGLVWCAGIIALFSIIVFLVLPPIMKSVLTKKMSQALHRRVTIEKISINPYSLHFSVKGITLSERDKKETFFSLGELSTTLSVNSVFKKALIVKELKIDRPYIHLVRNTDESYNFSDLLVSKTPEKKEVKPGPAKKESPFHFSFNNIVITGGSLDVVDGPKNINHTVRDLNIAVPFVSNIPYLVDKYINPSFSAKINEDIYTLKGETKPFAESRETHVDINIEHLNLPRYMAYVPVKMNFTFLTGVLDLTSRVSFVQSKNHVPTLTVSGKMALSDIALDDKDKRPLVRLPSMEIEVASAEPLTKTIHLSKVSLKGPDLSVKRGKDGGVNLASLIGDEQEKTKAVPTKKAPGKAVPTEKVPSKTAPPKASDESQPLNLLVDELLLEEGKVAFKDLSMPEPVDLVITSLAVKGEKISLEKGRKSVFDLSLLLNKKGKISMRGPIGINPLSADLAVDVKGLDIGPFQPYFTDKVRINTTGGSVNTTGTVVFTDTGKAGPDIKFKGSLLVANFASLDKDKGDDFLKWKALSLKGIDAGVNPLYAHVGGVSLTDFYARATVNPDGTLSFNKVLAEGAEEETEDAGAVKEKKETRTTATAQTRPSPPASTKKEPPPDISVGNIALQGGTIDFTDNRIKPSYSANLSELTGRIGGFSLKLNERADVEVRGKINNQVPLEIMGKISPAVDNIYADLAVRFNDLDLSGFTPYSGKYIGYKIEKGNLTINLKYLIDKRNLDSENVIFIDQLTLGDKVESPDAVKAPVRLAVALLKDRKGQIKLDIPVSGSLDDPQFSVFRIVIKVLLNLMAKAATAPFALLGALFGGGEELSYVEFDYGSSQMSQGNAKKVDTLVKALYERPSLRLDIEGHTDVEKDKEALKTYLFNKKIKTQKLNVLVKKGSPVSSVDEIKIEPNEYEQYLTMAYKAEKFEKPRNVLGLAKSLPVPEMEKLMLAHTVVGDGDLRTLAMQRAMRVKDALLVSQKITADRVFLVEPKSLSPAKKEKLKDSRVDLTLK